MKVGVLFSGGKDSTFALFKAMKEHSVCCLISVICKNPDSFMFHTPNIHLVEKQAECFGLPIVLKDSLGVKEDELKDLKQIILKAKEKFGISGIVTGGVASNYQLERIKKICLELGLEIVNPLWGMNQEDLMRDIVQNRFKFVFIKICCDGLDEKWLGKVIYNLDIDRLVKLNEKFGFNIAGEGGEFETFVVDGPIFKKIIKIIKSSKIMENSYTGWYKIDKVVLRDKGKKTKL